MMHRSILTSLGLALLVGGCGGQVPIGQGQNAVNSGGTGGFAGSGGQGAAGAAAAGSGGTDSRGGAGGSGATGSGGTDAGGGSGGSGATGGGGNCPSVVAGHDTTIAAPNAAGIAASANDIYWTVRVPSGGAVQRADKANLTPETFASAANDPSQQDAFVEASPIRVAGSTVYWTSHAGIELWSQPESGGAPTALFDDTQATDTLNTTTAEVLAIYGGNVYWDEQVENGGGTPRSIIRKMAVSGGTASELAHYDIDLQNPNLPATPLTMVADGSGLYYSLASSAGGPSLIEKMALDGSSVQDFSTLGDQIAIDDANVYNADGDFVLLLPKSGGNQMLFQSDTSNESDTPQGIAEYDGALYVTADSDFFVGGQWVQGCGTVRKIPIDGSPATVLWKGQGRPYAIAVDQGGVYWTDVDQKLVHVMK
jgi:hypothetical protein